jgi:hypothetical protein
MSATALPTDENCETAAASGPRIAPLVAVSPAPMALVIVANPRSWAAARFKPAASRSRSTISTKALPALTSLPAMAV